MPLVRSAIASEVAKLETSSIPFKNVIYSYPLASAMADGFVKEPAVATRENFDAANYTPDGLEQVKLEDGVRIHENTKYEPDFVVEARTCKFLCESKRVSEMNDPDVVAKAEAAAL